MQNQSCSINIAQLITIQLRVQPVSSQLLLEPAGQPSSEDCVAMYIAITWWR